MVDLSFEVSAVEAEPFSVSPLLVFCLRIANLTPRARIRNVMLSCQIRIEPTRRAYRAAEKERLVELFGAPEHWARSMRSFVFAHASVAVPAFGEETVARLPVACTRDIAAASAKYFDALVEGAAPLSFLFSGSVFYAEEGGALQIEQIPWSKEAPFRLPVATLERLMTRHYGEGDWIRLGAATLERLRRYQRRMGLLGEEDAVARLLDEVTTGAAP
ncbi:DUF6084 family protein [Methylosinus sp. Sm6]|uniref:DUF6084 family protein n=1 Tax=Methylosinus sp. Sm6 TaxID=2866948 RepID=UPI001C999313|nr:DUF6084 family protein [Methylosinus sp. Sm6]MBY6242551.1 DUF6084 family protein [Methylosinus sp. Sm6]